MGLMIRGAKVTTVTCVLIWRALQCPSTAEHKPQSLEHWAIKASICRVSHSFFQQSAQVEGAGCKCYRLQVAGTSLDTTGLGREVEESEMSITGLET